jgi:PBP1b-binding outer membrane lipoprotein LpoB
MNKKTILALLTSATLILGACSANSSNNGASGGEAKENTGFNPDKENGKLYSEIRDELGPVPKVTDELNLGGVAKLLKMNTGEH